MARSRSSSIKRTKVHFDREQIPAIISERYAVKLRRRIKNQSTEIKSRTIQNSQLNADNIVYRRKAHEHEFEMLRKDAKQKDLDNENDQLRAKVASWAELYQKERGKTRFSQSSLATEQHRSFEFSKRLDEEIEMKKTETERGDKYKKKLKECEEVVLKERKDKNAWKHEANRLTKSLGSLVTKVNEGEAKAKEVQKKTTDLFRSVSIENFNRNTESALLVKNLIDMAEQQGIIDNISCAELFKFFRITSRDPEETPAKVRIMEPLVQVITESSDEDANKLSEPVKRPFEEIDTGFSTPPQVSTQKSVWETQEVQTQHTQELVLNDSDDEFSYTIDHTLLTP